MTVSVLIPWRATDEWRTRALAWTTERYRSFGWEIVLGRCSGPWCKPAAVADAERRSHGDVLVVADADVWTESIEQAVHDVGSGLHAWIAPGQRVIRLNGEGTEQVYNGEPFGSRLRRERFHRFVVGGGVTVIDREVYRDVPLDPLFVGWGGEDIAWGWALRTLVHPAVQYRSILWHLWHPPAEDNGNANAVTEARAGAYRDALSSRSAMRALIEEGKTLLDQLAVLS